MPNFKKQTRKRRNLKRKNNKSRRNSKTTFLRKKFKGGVVSYEDHSFKPRGDSNQICYTEDPIIWTKLDEAVSIFFKDGKKHRYFDQLQYYLIKQTIISNGIFLILNTSIFGYIIDFIFTKMQELNIINKSLVKYNIGHKLLIIIAVFFAYVIRYPFALLQPVIDRNKGILEWFALDKIKEIIEKNELKTVIESTCNFFTNTKKPFSNDTDSNYYCDILRNIYLFLDDNKLGDIFDKLTKTDDGIIQMDILFILLLHTINLFDGSFLAKVDTVIGYTFRIKIQGIAKRIHDRIDLNKIYDRIHKNIPGEEIKTRIGYPCTKPDSINITCVPAVLKNAVDTIKQQIKEPVAVSTVANWVAQATTVNLNSNVQSVTATEFNKLFPKV
jgi:hypothetical protein